MKKIPETTLLKTHYEDPCPSAWGGMQEMKHQRAEKFRERVSPNPAEPVPSKRSQHP